MNIFKDIIKGLPIDQMSGLQVFITVVLIIVAVVIIMKLKRKKSEVNVEAISSDIENSDVGVIKGKAESNIVKTKMNNVKVKGSKIGCIDDVKENSK